MNTLDKKLMESNKITIHNQLEILKYISGEEKDNKPSGEGICVDIVLLPDLVLDIRKYNLEDENLELKSIAIGGRSGRISCVLAHLIDLYDGLYYPHLITKTGNLGKLILDNEFYNKDSEHEAEKLRKHILERVGEPRVTVWSKPNDKDFTTRKSSEDFELSDSDLKGNYFLNEYINKCRVIYLSSIRTPNFKRILKYLINDLKIAPGKLFIDCTRSEINHLKELIEIVTENKINYRAIEGIIISENERKLLKKEKIDYLKRAKELHFPILYYSKDIILQYDREGTRTKVSETNIHFDSEDIPERFKAGYILAYSLCSTINNLMNEVTSEQKKFVLNFINNSQAYWKEDPVKKMIYYGISIAKEVPNVSGNCDLRLLFENEDLFFPVQKFKPIQISTKDIAKNSEHIVIKDESINHLVRLSGFRRTGKLHNLEMLNRSHLTCKNNQNCKFYQNQPPNLDPHPYTAIMIDLDSTLMNSSCERRRGLEQALKIINHRLNFIDADYHFFENHIYGKWPLYKMMEKGDFRQEWNHKGWYITYILLRQDERLLNKIISDYARIPEPKKKHLGEIKNLIDSADWKEEFNNQYDIIERHEFDTIELAQKEFSAVRMYAYKEAFDFLKSLKETGIYNLYIVSEGNSDTQWLKLKSTGLSEFFPRERVLTTDDAAKPIKQITDLKKEKAIIESKLKEIELANKNISEENNYFSAFKRRMSARITINTNNNNLRYEILNSFNDETKKYEDDHFTQEQIRIFLNEDLYLKRKITIDFVDKVITRLSSKGGISFYATVIRSILNNPDKPLESLNDFGKLVDMELPNNPFRFAMIGDRQENDIEPVSKLLHKEYIRTIRLLSSTYFREEPFSEDYENNPNFIVHTLAQAKALLLSEQIWDNVFCTYDPPFFCWKVEFEKSGREILPLDKEIFNPSNVFLSVGLDIILNGMEMPSFTFPLTNKICRKILKEHLILNPKVNLIPIIDEYELLNMVENNKDILKRKTRILTSLVIDTNLKYGNFEAKRAEILRRLTKTLDYFQDNNINVLESNVIEKAIQILR
jgi:FMN phosphatase YigB (HAD superfamily)